MKEKIVIIFIAMLFGLFITTVIFYFYQNTKTPSKLQMPPTKQTANKSSITQKMSPSFAVDEPKNESIVTVRRIDVKGKTSPQDTVIISTNAEDDGGVPNADGTFAISVNIDTGSNFITVRSIGPDGSEKIDRRTVTYSTEDF